MILLPLSQLYRQPFTRLKVMGIITEVRSRIKADRRQWTRGSKPALSLPLRQQFCRRLIIFVVDWPLDGSDWLAPLCCYCCPFINCAIAVFFLSILFVFSLHQLCWYFVLFIFNYGSSSVALFCFTYNELWQQLAGINQFTATDD